MKLIVFLQSLVAFCIFVLTSSISKKLKSHGYRGDPCNVDADCLQGTKCFDSTKKGKKCRVIDGNVCTDDDHCGSGMCGMINKKTNIGQCLKSCTNDDDCRSFSPSFRCLVNKKAPKYCKHPDL